MHCNGVDNVCTGPQLQKDLVRHEKNFMVTEVPFT